MTRQLRGDGAEAPRKSFELGTVALSDLLTFNKDFRISYKRGMGG